MEGRRRFQPSLAILNSSGRDPYGAMLTTRARGKLIPSAISTSRALLGMLIVALAIGIAYFLAARLGLVFLAKPGLAVFWPAAGIAVGALIVLGRSARWPVNVAVVVATVLANMMIGRHASLAVVFGSG